MVDLERAEKEFREYVEQFNAEDEAINRKIGHSFRVMKQSQELAKKIGLEKEKIELATLIGLLHDMGRFIQRTKYKTFCDHESIDHGELGIRILEENNYLRKYIQTDQYDEIIKKAIRNHGKYGIEEGLDQEELLFAKIIKDADKLDIFYEAETMFWLGKETEIQKSFISKEVEKQFLENKLIDNSVKQNDLDKMIGVLSFIFDLNFEESFEILEQKQYIKHILQRFHFVGQTKENIEHMKIIIEEYCQNRIKQAKK